MKYRFFVLPILFLILTACEKEVPLKQTVCVETAAIDEPNSARSANLCAISQCIEYMEIWKSLFKEKNGFSEDYFDTHLEITQTELYDWEEAVYFQVRYRFTLDWASVSRWDQLVVYINDDNATLPELNLPRDTFLEDEHIRVVVENSPLKTLTNASELSFSNKEMAFKELLDFSGVNTLCILGLRVEEGSIKLHAAAEYMNQENACIFGKIDLVTGEKSVVDTACAID